MKRLIIIILMILLVPTSYVSAEDKETVDLPNNTLMYFKGYLTLVDKYDYFFFNEKMTKENEMLDCFDCIGEKKRLGRIGVGGKITNPLNDYENEKIKNSPFSWMIIPNIEESQPSGIIQFTYSY